MPQPEVMRAISLEASPCCGAPEASSAPGHLDGFDPAAAHPQRPRYVCYVCVCVWCVFVCVCVVFVCVCVCVCVVQLAVAAVTFDVECCCAGR